jgi:hypothetical protein
VRHQRRDRSAVVQPVDLDRVQTVPHGAQSNKVALTKFAKPARVGRSFREFWTPCR